MLAAAILIPVLFSIIILSVIQELKFTEHEIICLNWDSNPSPLIIGLTFCSTVFSFCKIFSGVVPDFLTVPLLASQKLPLLSESYFC